MKKTFFFSFFITVFLFSIFPTMVFTAPAGQDARPIKIGIIGPMDMRTGNHLFITAQMAADQINAAGGLKVGTTKRPIELIKINSNEYRKIAEAVSAAERAITADKVDFLIGGIQPEATAAIQDIAADHKVIYFKSSFIATQNYLERMAQDYNRYKYCFSSASLTTADIVKTHVGIVDVVANAIRQKGIATPRVAIIIEKTAAGDALFNFMSGSLKGMGMEIVGSWRPSPTAADLRAEAAAIKSSKPHIIYALFSAAAGVVLGKQIKELKIPAIAAGSPGAAVEPEELIPYSVSMQSAAAATVKITENNLPFQKEFTKRSGGEFLVISSYGVLMALAHSIEKVGSLDKDALIKSLETEEISGPVGTYKFDPKSHRVIFLKGFRPVYGIQALAHARTAIVWPTDSAVKAQPVEIPQWMADAWKNY